MWNMEQQFVVRILHAVFHKDSLTTTHPLTYDVYTPADIESMFDKISYHKGACVIRMIEHLIGTANFQTALRTYLKAKYDVI